MPSAPVSLPRLTRFWLPLQATWLMMASEGPFLAAIIARLPDPKHNLAAHGVAFALAIIVEAPVIMMMSASTALVDARPGYLALRRFAQVLNGGITAVMLVTLATGAMSWLLRGPVGLDPAVAVLTEQALWVLLPWPAAIGYRRFYQGILIRAGQTRRVAWGTGLRLVSMSGGAVAAATAGLNGAMVGAIGLSAGVCVEALASRVMAIDAVRSLPDSSPSARASADLSWPGLWRFYLPLAMTATISLAIHPVVTFFMGHARASLESLAVLPVVNSLIFIFRTPALSYQDVAIATLADGPQNRRPVLRFAGLLAMGATTALALIAWTPLSRTWFAGLSGLSTELTAFALGPARIMTIMPALSLLLNLERAVLVHARTTGPVTTASVLEVATIAAVLAIGVLALDAVGVTVAAVAFMAGRLVANAVLWRPAVVALQTEAPRS